MLKILDRYLIREIALPFAIALVVLTFVLMIPPILREAESFISKGVEWPVVVRAMGLLMPSALSLTIPVAVLFGILVGFGRLSADREFVAMQAGGVSLFRLLRPVALIALLGTAATAYETIVALPDSNQKFREIAVSVLTDRLENAVKPRVFFEDFPHRVIYVRNLPPEGGWRDVVLADMTRPGYTTVYFAREGRVLVDRARKLVQLQLIDYSSHTTIAGKPEVYEGAQSESITITLDPSDVFKPPLEKGAPEMTFAELNAAIAQAGKTGEPTYPYRFMIQYKWSLPATCPILALIGLGLGASNRKDGWIASIVLGFAVVLVYYVLLYGARAIAMGGRMSPEWAAWIPNLITAAAAMALIAWRVRSADRPIRFSLPAFWRRHPKAALPDVARHTGTRPRVMVVVRLPHINLPLPRLLDWYVIREYVRVFFVTVFILIGIFYISTVIDLADKMFRGEATTGMLLRFLYFQTPQYFYFVIPMAVLVATLVTLGVMTKNSELMVMRACGISLYRTAMPLMLAAVVAGGFLFVLQEQLLAYTNREADRLNRIMRGYPQITSPLDRRWLVGTSGDLYHYDFYDVRANRFTRLLVYRLDDAAWKLKEITYAAEAGLMPRTGSGEQADSAWVARNGWTRDFAAGALTRQGLAAKYTPFTEQVVPLEAPTYFKSEMPEADLMTYGQLRDYITQLRSSGADVVPDAVKLQRKVAFPFVTIILTLLAVPFAVTTGRRGALYGVGIGIVLAITYRIMESVFGALGAGGVLAPTLAAWAPNVLFGAAALYMILTVRT
jgi:LPS export ABC transporter permease LptG/LPS export ABC transporter permease LptF